MQFLKRYQIKWSYYLFILSKVIIFTLALSKIIFKKENFKLVMNIDVNLRKKEQNNISSSYPECTEAAFTIVF